MSLTPLPLHPQGPFFVLLAMNGSLPAEQKFRENTVLAYTCTVYCIMKHFLGLYGISVISKKFTHCVEMKTVEPG